MSAQTEIEGDDFSLDNLARGLRATLFKLFGAVLIEPTEEILMAMAMPELVEGVEFVYGPRGLEVFDELAERCRDSTSSKITKEHDRFFKIPVLGFIPPFASAFWRQEGRRQKKGCNPLMGKPALEAIALMKLYDLELDRQNLLPDHAGVLLMLYGEILGKKEEEGVRGKSRLERPSELLASPLYRWLDVFFDSIFETADEPFWRSFARAVPVFIRLEQEGCRPDKGCGNEKVADYSL